MNYYFENREKRLQYYYEHREERLAYQKEYNQTEYYKKYQHEYYEKKIKPKKVKCLPKYKLKAIEKVLLKKLKEYNNSIKYENVIKKIKSPPVIFNEDKKVNTKISDCSVILQEKEVVIPTKTFFNIPNNYPVGNKGFIMSF